MIFIVALVISILLFLIAFLFLLIFGLLKRKRRIFLLAIFSLIIALLFGILSAYQIASKSYNHVTGWFKARSGSEIYEALFDRPVNSCHKVLDFQDPVIPRIDTELLLHFTTCPEEMKRILHQKEFSFSKISNAQILSASNENDTWFKPELLGDTVLIFEHQYDNSSNFQRLYSNMDSTEVYLIDVWD